MVSKKIVVIILGYNSQKYLDSLFESLVGQNYLNADYYYVDNASVDNSIEIVKKFKFVKIIQNKKNYGYAGAYSRFLKEVFAKDYDGAILLNPDVVVGENWLGDLVEEAFADKSIGAVHSKIMFLDKDLNKTNEVVACGGDLHFLGFGILNDKYCDCAKNSKQVSFISGTSFLVKREAYLKVGGLDEDYFLYSEDVDLCWRIQLVGYKCMTVENSKVWHHYVFDRAADNRKKFYYLERNRLSGLLKNYSYKTFLLLLPALVILDFGIILHSIKNKYFIEKIQANWDFVKIIPDLCKKHKIIQKNKIILDKQLFELMSKQIQFDELDSVVLRMANKFFVVYYDIVKHLI